MKKTILIIAVLLLPVLTGLIRYNLALDKIARSEQTDLEIESILFEYGFDLSIDQDPSLKDFYNSGINAK
jgi:hypothetical protein